MTNTIAETIQTGYVAGTGGITQGYVVGIASGKIEYAQTDATAVLPIGIAASTFAAGEYVSIYKEGSRGYVYVKSDSAIGTELTCGVASDAGAAITAAAEGLNLIVAIPWEDTAATTLTLCKIVFYSKYIAPAE
jgi:hypothetical protein